MIIIGKTVLPAHNSATMRTETVVCPSCKKEFLVEYMTYPSKTEDKRMETVACHYCDAKCGAEFLLGTEIITKVKSQAKGGNLK